MPVIKGVLLVLAFGYISACVALYVFQRDLLYFPTPEYAHRYTSISIGNEGETIKVIVLNQGHENGILYFGGNAESVLHSAEDYARDFPNHTIYFVNYRGYGGSSGAPSEKANYSDALDIYDLVKKQHSKLSLIGRSLGTGIASYVAVHREIEKILLITPYDSIEKVAASQYPIFPVSLLLKDRYDSVSRAGRIRARTLILLAEDDRVIPRENSMRLVEAFPASIVTVATIKGVDHTTISQVREFKRLIQGFMQ